MLFKKFLKRILNKERVCDKCNSFSDNNFLCFRCQEYIDYTELKKQKEIEAKGELKRRNWIEIRDEFLKNKNG